MRATQCASIVVFTSSLIQMPLPTYPLRCVQRYADSMARASAAVIMIFSSTKAFLLEKLSVVGSLRRRSVSPHEETPAELTAAQPLSNNYGQQIVPTDVATISEPSYESRVAAEITTFTDDQVVHDLPAIFHYWSNKFLLPKIDAFGFRHPDDFFVKQFAELLTANGGAGACNFISVGSGNCDTEVRVAKALVSEGFTNFAIECLELNDAMLDRGRGLAETEAVTQYVIPRKGDFNSWTPDKPYHAVMANQSLHHVLNLEDFFDAVHTAIGPNNGVLVTSDMIGRNGHQRWPEALKIVEEYWQRLTPNQRYNRQLQRQEDAFVNWDCSVQGFEGIRAQDILPLLIDRFHFDMFVPFGNVISPFIDRGFGPNFDTESTDDRALIDEIHERDECEMLAGNIKPTQMFAVLSLDYTRPSRCIAGLTPAFCVRTPDV